MSMEAEKEVMLTLEEFGILCFTNSYYLDDELSNHMDVLLTSRQSYFWVPIIAHLIKETELTIEEIKVFIEVSLNSLMTKNEARWNNRVLGVEGMLGELETVLFYSTRLKFNNPVLEHQSLFGSFLDEILRRLENHNLILDKHIEILNGTTSVMMGLIPMGITKRTQIGEEIFLKFSNTFRKMELQKSIKGSQYEPHYKFYLIWEIFKNSIFNTEDIFGSARRKK
ncbi:MAG: hypothetical protein JXR07_08035 [Reichenbachiella sp.]